MRSPGRPLLVAGTALLLASCGSDDGPSETRADKAEPRTREPRTPFRAAQLIRDRRGDVSTIAAEVPPRDPALDLRSVSLRRSRSGLRVRFVLAGRPAGDALYVVETLGPRTVRAGRIELHFRDGRPEALARPFGKRYRPVPFQIDGRQIEITAPLGRFTRAPRFKWRASSKSERPTRETRDKVPQTKFALFPPS